MAFGGYLINNNSISLLSSDTFDVKNTYKVEIPEINNKNS